MSDTPVMIACSGGTSSILLVALVIKGWIDRPKHLLVLFADTGWDLHGRA